MGPLPTAPGQGSSSVGSPAARSSGAAAFGRDLPDAPPYKVYMGNVSYDLTDAAVRDLFRDSRVSGAAIWWKLLVVVGVVVVGVSCKCRQDRLQIGSPSKMTCLDVTVSAGTGGCRHVLAQHVAVVFVLLTCSHHKACLWICPRHLLAELPSFHLAMHWTAA